MMRRKSCYCHTWPAWTQVLGVLYFLLPYLCIASGDQTLTPDDVTVSLDQGWEPRRDVRFRDGSSALPVGKNLPKFYSPSLRLLIQRGDRLMLPCKVENLGDDHIIWRHGANIIAGSNIPTYFDSEGRIRLFENFTLEITNVSEKDEGVYECALASTSGSALKLVHTVTVQDPPSVAVLPAKGSVVVIEGETVQIGCIPQGNPKPRITWSKKDGPIPSHHEKLFNESVITMKQVSRKHTGLYVCSADNGVGLPAIGAVYVRVLHAPEVRVPRRRVHGGVRHKATLTCIVYADPKADVHWYVGQRPVAIGDRIRAEKRDNAHSITIYAIRESDFGTYMCTANNTYGHDLRHIEFSGVPNPPVFSRWETLPWTAPNSKIDTATANNTNPAEDLHVNTISPGLQNEQPVATTESPVSHDVQVQLFWAVECYSPLIDYKLAFRPAPPKVTSENEVHSPPWTELTIPADPSSTFLHTKSFVLRGLEVERIYESAIKARNRYGWSPISSVFYFSTFPNTSSNGGNLTEIMRGETVDSKWHSHYGYHYMYGKGHGNDSMGTDSSTTCVSHATFTAFLLSILVVTSSYLLS